MRKQTLPYDSEENIYLDMTTHKGETDSLDDELIKRFDELKMTDREIELFKVARYASYGECESRLHGVASVMDGLLNKREGKEDIRNWVLGLFDWASETTPLSAEKIKSGALSLCESEQDERAVIISAFINQQWEMRLFDILATVIAEIMTDHKDVNSIRAAFWNE